MIRHDESVPLPLERLWIVSEHYETTLASLILERQQQPMRITTQRVRLWAYEMLRALVFLHHHHGIAHRNLSLKSVCVTTDAHDHQMHVKLANYGLYFATAQGADVDFPFG